MARVVSPVSSKGQVTIPAEIRRRLGIEPGGRVAFILDGDVVTLAPVSSTLLTSFQAVPPLPQDLDPEEAIRLAAEEHALVVAREGL